MGRSWTRREFVRTAAAGAASGVVAWEASGGTPTSLAQQPAGPGLERAGNLHLATFRFDVTPPMGHSLCGGWIKPVVGYDDPLEAIGLVLLGAGDPIVLCVVDWTGLLNGAHVAWRQALAEAAGTTPERVAVHCVHQHNAPFACLDAEKIVGQYADLPHIVELDFFRRCLDAGRQAVRESLPRARKLTHIGQGQGRVEKVAGNRRILGPDGKVRSQRGSSSKNPEHHRLPEGLIDPFLKTVAFYDGSQRIAACHYYACHPMSYYGDGRVSADFAGLARKQRQQQDPQCTHLYFNGCGGNIGAGKYNDGSPEMRPVLTQRILDGILAAEGTLRPEPLNELGWRTHPVLPPPHPRFDARQLADQIADPQQPVVGRNRPSYTLAWIQRHQRQEPIVLSGLHLNRTSLLHLPSECFVEYQLRAQKVGGERFVATAAYGDGGPWYIPTAEAYPQGGYAVSVAFCDPQVEGILNQGVERLLHV